MFTYRRTKLYHEDCFVWLRRRRRNSVHGVVTDPPYGLVEYSPVELERRDNGRGVWRLPPAFDQYERRPLPRFTELRPHQIDGLYDYFYEWGTLLRPVLVPGAHVLVASTPLLEHMLLYALHKAGFERRGQVIRLVTTFRGGDRPKYAHEEFPEVSVMARAMHEPWVLFRKPVEKTVRENLRTWGTGALRRPSRDQPFGDVIPSGIARRKEKDIAPHPTLKPQAFLRQAVRAILPLGTGVVLDPFAGSGSTLAAADAVGYRSIGVEVDPGYVQMAREAIPGLAAFVPPAPNGQRLNGHAPTTSNEGRVAPRSAGDRLRTPKA
jgi:site-specific DNA-methyltransferase (adenine-specific)